MFKNIVERSKQSKKTKSNERTNLSNLRISVSRGKSKRAKESGRPLVPTQKSNNTAPDTIAESLNTHKIVEAKDVEAETDRKVITPEEIA